MIEVITAIALLCQVAPSTAGGGYGSSYTPQRVADYQLKCQQEYLKCVKGTILKKHAGDIEVALGSCIIRRK